MVSVETTPESREGRIKEYGWGAEFMQDIFETL
jgi:hypothetical protein